MFPNFSCKKKIQPLYKNKSVKIIIQVSESITVQKACKSFEFVIHRKLNKRTTHLGNANSHKWLWHQQLCKLDQPTLFYLFIIHTHSSLLNFLRKFLQNLAKSLETNAVTKLRPKFVSKVGTKESNFRVWSS